LKTYRKFQRGLLRLLVWRGLMLYRLARIDA
jgi:hypothetical protein